MVARLELQDVFKEKAEWAREKAYQYPNEERNLEGADIFDKCLSWGCSPLRIRHPS